jgi:hypothetical protein
MNVEIGAEATLFPEKEYIRGIFVAVRRLTDMNIQTFDVNCVTFCRYPVQASPLDDLRQGAELPDDSTPLQQRHPHVERLQLTHGITFT